MDIALDCAADTAVEPATLIRAARDFTTKDPTFAANVAFQAIAHLLAGRGYEVIPSDLDTAASHLLAAPTKLDQVGWALALRRLEANPLPHADGLMMLRLRATIVIFENAVVSFWLCGVVDKLKVIEYARSGAGNLRGQNLTSTT